MAPLQGGAFDFELSVRADAVAGNGPLLRMVSSSSSPELSLSEHCFEARTPPSSSVTAVTVRDAFDVDLTLVQTYSQAQGVV